jgi:ABC-2 type transport system permease protein
VSKTWLIIKHEYLTNVKRRSFLFAAFGAPLISLVLLTVVFGLIFSSEADVERLGQIGYVDEAGVLEQQVAAPENFIAYETEAAARADLDNNTLGAYFVLPQDYLDTGDVRLISKTGIPDALNDMIDSYLRANLSVGLPQEIAARIQDPLEISIRTLDNGRVLRDNAIIGLFLVPIVFMMVFLFASQTTSGYLMGSIVEEKTNRIVEILVTSVTPFQLLFGKILGLGLLGLTQLVVWMVFGVITLTLGRNLSFLNGVSVPLDLVVVGAIYFLLDYFLLSSVMACIGVISGSEQESRQYAGIFSLIMVLPVFFIVSFITDPNGAVVTFLSLFPLTSPLAVILRLGFGSVPSSQLFLSLVILGLTGLVMTWAAARIFRWGLLLYGKRPSLRELWRVMRRPPTMATSASGEIAP